ncbi:MAG: hypothetical protein A2X81_15815 [Desulfobacterales bacterium GWB2_56_26]|nr:MAG: hypothetical protein A2X81_15815 [Desulfobacterales bacterium GWB2_56_26]
MRRIVHQWRDWLLEFIGDDKYELTRKDNTSISHTFMAKNSMDAETEGQKIILKNNENDVNSILQK